jgi:hypothetical protein
MSAATVDPVPLPHSRIAAFRGALCASGDRSFSVDERTIQISGITIVFDGFAARVSEGSPTPTLAERLASLSSIFRIPIFDANGSRLEPLSPPPRESDVPVVTFHAPLTAIDTIIDQCALVARCSPREGRIELPDVDAVLALCGRVVRVRFTSMPPAHMRVKLGGALLQILRTTDALEIGTRVALASAPPPWLARLLETLGWRTQGTAGVEFARAPRARGTGAP